MRELSQLLDPVFLDDFGLDAGLRWLTDGFAQRTGIRTTYASTFTSRLDSSVETHLFRIAQEALTNIARHSRATRATVELHPIEKGMLRLSIEDNGQGLVDSDEGKHTSLGLTGMRARAQEIHGSIRMSRPEDGGLRIEVDVPLEVTTEIDADQKNTHSIGR